jgi:hypothetical protein
MLTGNGRVSKSMAARLVFSAALFGIACAPLAHSATATVTQTLNAQLSAAVDITLPASLTLTNTGTVFNNYTGSMTVQYRVRTTTTGTGGTLTVQATANFAAGGPSVASNTLTYTCSGATLGTACSGTRTVSLTAATNVLTVPTGICTGAACGNASPNMLSTSFTLVDDPAYQTGSYSATLTFTVSAT